MITETQRGLILGFTGTRKGMTERQRFAVSEFLFQHRPIEVHHGDCKGADNEFHDAALMCNGNFPPRTHGHPCGIECWRAGRRFDSLHPVKDPLARNRDIVEASDHLLAAPAEMFESKRSGTWQTVRFARSIQKPVTIVWPDGTVQAVSRSGWCNRSLALGNATAMLAVVVCASRWCVLCRLDS